MKHFHEVVNMFHVAAKQKNIHIRLNSMDQRIPKNLIGDSIRLKQVLSNLVGNSVRFTNHGEVTINLDLEELYKFRKINYICTHSLSITTLGISFIYFIKRLTACCILHTFGKNTLFITSDFNHFHKPSIILRFGL